MTTKNQARRIGKLSTRLRPVIEAMIPDHRFAIEPMVQHYGCTKGELCEVLRQFNLEGLVYRDRNWESICARFTPEEWFPIIWRRREGEALG